MIENWNKINLIENEETIVQNSVNKNATIQISLKETYNVLSEHYYEQHFTEKIFAMQT